MRKLVVISGADKGRKFELPASGTFSLGRGNPPESRSLNDEKVSRTHAVVTIEGGRVLITDMKSKLGTFMALATGKPFQQVNGQQPLPHGAVIRVGNTELRFEDDNIAEQETAAGNLADIEAYRRQVEAERRAGATIMGSGAPVAPPAQLVPPQPLRPPTPAPAAPQPVIQVRCSCGQQLMARERYAGARVRCPNCGDLIILPGRPAVVRPQNSLSGSIDFEDDEPATLQPPSMSGSLVGRPPPLPRRRIAVSTIIALVGVVLLVVALAVSLRELFTK